MKPPRERASVSNHDTQCFGDVGVHLGACSREARSRTRSSSPAKHREPSSSTRLNISYQKKRSQSSSFKDDENEASSPAQVGTYDPRTRQAGRQAQKSSRARLIELASECYSMRVWGVVARLLLGTIALQHFLRKLLEVGREVEGSSEGKHRRR